jgi:hypothetical protein
VADGAEAIDEADGFIGDLEAIGFLLVGNAF